MFKVPQPKYDIGDVVYWAKYESYMRKDVCPDCLGEKEWHVTLPNKEDFQISCSTCSAGLFYGSTGKIGIRDYHPSIWKVTIERVLIDTSNEKHPITYMTKETGCPSGSLLHEEDLFSLQSEAYSAAKAKVESHKAYMEKTELEAIEREKKKSRYKPSWEKRRIKELEKEIKRLEKEVKKLEKEKK